MYGLPRQPLTAGFCEALASRHLILCFFLLTFLLNPGKAGAVAFVYSALRWADCPSHHGIRGAGPDVQTITRINIVIGLAASGTDTLA